MEVDFSGNYTNPENCQEGDLGVILSEGKMEEAKSFAGQDYKKLNLDVEVNGKKLIHSPGMQEGKKLVNAWGSETKKWISKKFVCHLVRYVSQGQTKQKIEIEPIEQKA